MGPRSSRSPPTPSSARGSGCDFPLWSGGHVSENALAMDPSKALAAGLTLRPLADSVDDVVAWWGDRPWPDHWLTEDAERDAPRRGGHDEPQERA